MIPWSPIVSRWSSLNVPYAWMTAVAQNATKCPTVDVYFALIVSQVILNQKSKMEIHHLHARTQLVEKQSRSGISRFMSNAINSIVLKDYNLTEHLIELHRRKKKNDDEHGESFKIFGKSSGMGCVVHHVIPIFRKKRNRKIE